MKAMMNKVKLSISKNQSGFSLVELTTAALLIGVVLVVIGGATTDFLNRKSQVDLSQNLIRIRNEVILALRSPQALELLKNENAAKFSCLTSNPPNCTGVADQEVQVIGTNGTALPWTNLTSNVGISPQGEVCNNYDVASPSKACPFKLRATWSALCESNPCPNPTIMVRVRLEQVPSRPYPQINEDRYLVTQPFRQLSTDPTIVCSGNGATYDPVLKKCIQPPGFNSGCPAGKYMVGFDQHGNARCIDFPTVGQCPVGQILKRINTDGTIVCAPGCVDAVISAGTMCLPRVTTPAPVGPMVASLLARGLVTPNQVKTAKNKCLCAATATCWGKK